MAPISLFGKKGYTGLADSPFSGGVGSVSKSIGIDHRSEPGLIKVHQKLTKETGDNVPDEFVGASVAGSDGKNYFFSKESGKIWREDGGVWSEIVDLTIHAWDAITLTLRTSINSDTGPTVPPGYNKPLGWSDATGGTDVAGEVFFFGGDAGVGRRKIYRYTVTSTADLWDITALDENSESTYDHSAQTEDPYVYFVKPGGGNWWVTSDTVIYQYSMTGWGVSSSSYQYSYTPSEVTGNIEMVRFSTNGTKMFVAGRLADNSVYVFQYTLATPWNVSTASYDSVSLEIPAIAFQGVYPVAMSPDGKMIVAINGSMTVAQYFLGTAWDLSSATLDKTFNIRNSVWSTSGTSGFMQTIPASGSRKARNVVYFGGSRISSINDNSITQSGSTCVEYTITDGNDEGKILSATEHPSLYPDVNWNPTYFIPEPCMFFSTEKHTFRFPLTDPSKISSVGPFANGDKEYHPMRTQNLHLFIGDAKDMAMVDQFGNFSSTSGFNLPEGERIKAIETYDVDLLVGTERKLDGRILRWFTETDSWQAEDVIYEKGGINAFIRDDNYVYAQAGYVGNLYYYNGEKMERFRKVPGDYNKGEMYVNHAAVGYFMGTPVFGVSNKKGNPTLQGVYGFGRYSRDYSMSLSLDFPISEDEFEGVQIGTILVVDRDMFVSWKSGENVGIDKIDWTAKYPNAHFETGMLVGSSDRTVFKTVARTHAPYYSLPENTSVSFKYKKRYEPDWNDLTSVEDAAMRVVRSEMSIPQMANYQLRVSLNADGNNAPEIEDVLTEITGLQRQP